MKTTRYDKAIDSLKQGMIDIINGVEISSEKEEEIKAEFYDSMQEYVKNVSCIKKFTGVSVDFKEVGAGLSSYKPFVVKTNEGFVTFVHGTPNGEVAIEGENGPIRVYHTSEKFADLVEVQETYIASCYPGGKKQYWKSSGKKFFNIGNQLRPIGLAIDGDTLYIGYVSPYHQQFIENEFHELSNKLAAVVANK